MSNDFFLFIYPLLKYFIILSIFNGTYFVIILLYIQLFLFLILSYFNSFNIQMNTDMTFKLSHFVIYPFIHSVLFLL